MLRRGVESLLLCFGTLLLFRAVGAEPYGVPTGSMAPALLGNHRVADCPRCGYPVRVGHREDQRGGYATCPNCGLPDVPLDGARLVRGDQLLVSKTVFDWRSPRRWEMAVFRCPAEPDKVFVKRVVGLPGESVQLRDGDLVIDHQLARKSLAECRAVRIPVFDLNHHPPGAGWQPRWQAEPPAGPVALEGAVLRLDTAGVAEQYSWLAYHHRSLDGGKERPVADEFSYNGDPGRPTEPVHDLYLELDLEVLAGDGSVALTLTDGQDEAVVELPVGSAPGGTRLGVRPRQADAATPEADRVFRTAPDVHLEPGRTYRVELVLVDRRVHLALDGEPAFAPLDLPEADGREEVTSPARVGTRGADVRVRNFKLYRDIHYVDAGRHGGRSPVRLGAGEYFVLGDNSPNSDDSRFWSDEAGRFLPVRGGDFVGKPFLVHMPSRLVRWQAWGRQWEYQGLDWSRVRRVY